MTIEEMIAKCHEQQELTGQEDTEVMFIIPGRWGKQNTRRLFPGGPKGEIVAETERGVHCFFKANEVIAALEQMAKKLTEEQA